MLNIVTIMETFENGQHKQAREEIKRYGKKKFILEMVHADTPPSTRLTMIEFAVK